MTNIEQLLTEYLLEDETHRNLDIEPNLSLFAKNDELWSKLFSKKFDNAELRVYFLSENESIKLDYLKFAIACMNWFVQINFTGPPVPAHMQEYLDKDKFKNKEFANRLCMYNNEDINVNCKYPVLLVAAEVVFDTCMICEVVNYWWSCRTLMIHQDVLDEFSPTLLTNAERMFRLIPTDGMKDNHKAQLYMEVAQLYLKFCYINKAQELINSAQTLLGVSYELVGKLGRRTKFQERDVAQLALEVKIEPKNGVVHHKIEEFPVPANITLKDDERLDKIEFSSDNVDTTIQFALGNLRQKLLLTIFLERLIATPSDELRGEELMPFLDVILSQNNTYSLRTVALFYRNRMETKDRRAIERCMQQCEELINSLKRDNPKLLNRVGDVYLTAFPPFWKIKEQYADVLLNIGLVKQSLDIYLELKLWDEVIVCYTILNLRQKAIDLIKELLANKPSVKLLCLLGDATEETKYYEEAWNLSKKRSHRAQRHWGLYFYGRKQYKEAIPHFEKTLSINPLQANIWIRLGFAALQVENWQTAATAYRRYTNLEPNGLEAWNNLAQAYIKMGNKRSAHQSLSEALKCNFENWRVWENFMMVSCYVSNWNDVIRSYHRLMDLKEKYLNTEALAILVDNIKGELDDADENSEPSPIMKKTRELLGRIVSVFPTSGFVWELYATLSPVMLLRAQRLQRAFRCYAVTPWETNSNSCVQVLKLCNLMADMALAEGVDGRNTIVRSIKLNVSSALITAQRKEYEEAKELMKETTEKLKQLNEKIANAPPFAADNCYSV